MNVAKKPEYKKPAAKSVKRIIVLDFTASWCGPCQAMKKPLAAVAAAHPEIDVRPIDIDKRDDLTRELVKRFEIMSVPQLVFLSKLGDTLPLHVEAGGVGKPTIEKAIEKAYVQLAARG